jgi:hypothetical protein
VPIAPPPQVRDPKDDGDEAEQDRRWDQDAEQ